MLTPDTVLQNRYKLTEQLSANPSRQTWLASDEEGDRPVVLKLLALGGVVKWHDLKLFEREAETLAQLEHPRIPKYYDFFSVDDRELWFGLVQQYIPGISLKQKLQQRRSLACPEVQKIALDVLEILTFLHNQSPPVLHRDLKPSNLIWGEDDRIYLIDFGAVQAKSPHPGATFTIVGTYGYTPLEQYGGQAVAASDLYALGATLIHLLTGIAPSELPQQELKMQFRDRLPASVDSAFAAWLEVMTAIGVKKRYQSTTEALEALQKPQPEITALRRQRRTPKPSPKSATPQARLQKSLDNLQIEIPSPFEVEWLQPGSRFLQRWLERGYDYLQAGVRWYKNLEAMQKKRFTKIVVGLGLLIGFLSATGVLPIVAFVQESAIALLTLAIALLGLVLPLGAIAFWLLQQNRSEYFEKTCVSFYPKYFAVERFSLQNHQRHFGQIAQIQALEITTQRDRHGRLCQGIVVEYNDASPNPHRYFFGENLSPTELEKLRQEIQLWLANISVPTTPESSSDTPQN